MDVIKKIEDIEHEMAKTQKNKATAGHLGMLKAKLAKLRRELITPKSQVNNIFYLQLKVNDKCMPR
jgi:ribosome-interacting GTPase 1